MKLSAAKKIETLHPVGNGGESAIQATMPYAVSFTVEGTAPLLFHRWDVDSIQMKADAAKGSKAKKSDDIESYVYRNKDNDICIPGEYFRMSIVNAAKYLQDPRSPRKSAMDLFKAGIAVLTELCSLGSNDWDYLDKRRVQVQRNGITRTRPAFKTGWKATCTVQVVLPEYITQQLFREVVINAGRLVGVGDFRPTNGRFSITNFEVHTD